MFKSGWLTSVLLATLLAVPAHAATFLVSNANDSGPGSLRQAITDANNAPQSETALVQFSQIHAPIKLESGLPTATRSMEIRGLGYPYTPVIDGQGQYPVFRVDFNSSGDRKSVV